MPSWIKSMAGILGGCVSVALGAAACRQIVGFDETERFRAAVDAGAHDASVDASACGLPYGATTCAACIQANCCDQSRACAADAPCAGVYECLGGCPIGDLACRTQCWTDHTSGNDPTGPPLVACSVRMCESECALSCGASTVLETCIPEHGGGVSIVLPVHRLHGRARVRVIGRMRGLVVVRRVPGAWPRWPRLSLRCRTDGVGKRRHRRAPVGRKGDSNVDHLPGVVRTGEGLELRRTCHLAGRDDGRDHLEHRDCGGLRHLEGPRRRESLRVPVCGSELRLPSRAGAERRERKRDGPVAADAFWRSRIGFQQLLAGDLRWISADPLLLGRPRQRPSVRAQQLRRIVDGRGMEGDRRADRGRADATRGAIAFYVFDCSRSRTANFASGVRVTLDVNDDEILQYYGMNFDFTAAQTDATGWGGFVNVPPGPVTVTATPVALGKPSSAARSSSKRGRRPRFT